MLSMFRFDERRLEQALQALTPHKRAVFALACAERLRPLLGYPKVGASSSTLDTALVALRVAVESGSVGLDLAAAVQACEAGLDPDDDAVAALTYAYQVFAADTVDAAVFAARRGYEARDRLATDQQAIEFTHPGAESTILSHAAVQDELRHQAEDLTLLAASDGNSTLVLDAAQRASGRIDAV